MKTITIRTIQVRSGQWRWEIWERHNLLKQGFAEDNALAAYSAGFSTYFLMREGKLRLGEFEVKMELDCTPQCCGKQ